MESLYIVLLMAALICGFIAATIAEKKWLSWGGYFAFGFFFGPIGILAAVLAATRVPAQGAPQSRLDAATAPSAISEQLKELSELHASGVLTDDEFRAAKAKLLS